MDTARPVWDFRQRIVLLPNGPGDEERFDAERCLIEQMQGRVASLQTAKRGRSVYGESPSKATHEFIPDRGHAITVLPPLTAAELRESVQQAYAEYTAFLSKYARPTYIPVVTGLDTLGKESRYFGQPWIPESMPWPHQDGTPMAFVLQLDLASLPAHPGGIPKTGLLLFFHGPDYDPETQSYIVVVDPTQPGGLRPSPTQVKTSPALGIIQWHPATDFPSWEDLETLDGGDVFIDISESYCSTTLGTLLDAEGCEHTEKDALEAGIQGRGHCYESAKLGGWPRWEQGNEVPDDREHQPMEFVMQVGHEGLLLGNFDQAAIAWPTWGRGHIFYSTHTGEFQYRWACG